MGKMIYKGFTYFRAKSIFTSVRTKNKKMILKTPHSKYFIDRIRSTPVLVISSIVAIAAVFIIGPRLVGADAYQAQINSLNQQNAQTQNLLNSLTGQASSYQQVVNGLQTQINGMQSAIYANQAKQSLIQNQILANKTKLARQKKVLADDIKTMYISGQLTPVEMLATSSSISNYVDQQVAYSDVQQKIEGMVKTINGLQKSLKDQQTQIDALLKTEQTQNQLLINDQNQENKLLSYNQSQQASYSQKIKGNDAAISQLMAEQASANASISRSVGLVTAPSNGSGGRCDINEGNGGYPMSLCNVSKDSIVDAYGFPNRECTSFANWYFKNIEGQSGFSVNGNAGWWYLTSNYPALTYSGGVKPGAIGVEPSSSLSAPVPSLHGGYYGHVMIVLALPGTTYNGSLPYTSAMTGTLVPSGYVLVMSMNEDNAGHFMYNLWPDNYLMYINPQ